MLKKNYLNKCSTSNPIKIKKFVKRKKVKKKKISLNKLFFKRKQKLMSFYSVPGARSDTMLLKKYLVTFLKSKFNKTFLKGETYKK